MFDNSLFYRMVSLTDDATFDADFRPHINDSYCQFTRFKQLTATGLEYKPYVITKELLNNLVENVVYLHCKNEVPTAYRDNNIGKTVVYGDLDSISKEDVVLGDDITCIGLMLIRFGRFPQNVKFKNKSHVKIKFLKSGEKENDISY